MLFLATRKRMDEREEGFTLIELLVVVIIIGILAAIAIPAFLNQRQRAQRSSVQSDLRNAAVQAETFFTDAQTYDGFEGDALFTSIDGVNEGTAGVTLTMEAGDSAANNFCIEGTYTGLGETWRYDSDASPQLSQNACP